MKHILLIGGPGSGKGTAAKYLKTLAWYDAYHISTGELFRHHMSNDTEIGLEVKAEIAAGGLAKDDITVRMMKEVIDGTIDNMLPFTMADEVGFVFDGFPRTLTQAPLLESLLAEHNDTLHCVIYLDAPDEVLIERLKYRSTVENRPEDSDDEYCKKRIAVFREQTIPLVDYYKNLGILHEIDASKSIDEVNNNIDEILEAWSQLS